MVKKEYYPISIENLTKEINKKLTDDNGQEIDKFSERDIEYFLIAFFYGKCEGIGIDSLYELINNYNGLELPMELIR